MTIAVQPADTHVQSGATASFSVQATGPGQYQWEYRAAGAGANDWQDIAGATKTVYTTAPTTNGNDGDAYRVVVTWAGGVVQRSSIATLWVQPAPVAPSITVQPVDAMVIEDQYAAFNVTASGTSLAYRWQTSKDGTTWADSVFSMTATLQLYAETVADDGTLVRVVVSNALGSVTSNVVRLNVQHAPAAPMFNVEPQSTSVVIGQAATFNAQAFGTPAPDIVWQMSIDGSSWTTLPDATTGTYTLADATLQDSGHAFRAVASNSLGTAYSGIVYLTVTPVPVAPAITAAPASMTVGAGSNATFSASVSGQPSPGLQWQVSTDAGTTFSTINGAVSASYTAYGVGTAQDGWRYRIVATNSEGSVTSSAATLSVLALPSFTLQPTSTSWHPGVVPAYFLAGVSGAGASLQWQTSRDAGTTWNDVDGATGTSFLLSSVSDAGVDRVRLAASNAGGTTYSDQATVTPNYWSRVNGAFTSSNLSSVRWTSPTTAIAAGGLGTMLRSTDSGQTWSVTAQLQTSSPTTLAVQGQTAIALGYGWTVLRSVDAGAHWIRGGYLNVSGSARGMAFSGSAATAVGDGGLVERSTDGGATWQAATTDGATSDLRGVAFNAAGVGVAVGDSASVLRSTDGGASWSTVSISQGYLLDVAFVDASTVVATGWGGQVMRSTDAGLTWQAVNTGSALYLFHVAFDRAGNGIAGDSNGDSQTDILHTTDGGQTWAVVHVPGSIVAADYAPVATAATAVAVGDGGSVATSADGGVTWTSRTPGPQPVLRGIAFASPAIGAAVGDAGTILRTVDGGDSWAAVSGPSSTMSMNDIAFPTPQVAIAVGDGAIWRSVDAGATWSAVIPRGGPALRAVRFTSPTHGVAVSSGSILYTDDAGLTWQSASTDGAPMVQSVAFGSSLVGVAVGDGLPPGGWGIAGGAIQRTTDGGATWTSVSMPYSVDLTSVDFFDANTVVAVGMNGELRSTDGGQTWASVPTYGQQTGLGYASTTEGVSVFLDGFIARTHDAGLTWPDGEYIVDDQLCNVVVSPAGRVFVTTGAGAVYRDDAP
jgi:photosystem II stability/assembly factor-like uncharacterized protein